MIVQIYSLTHPDDVRDLVRLGVDHIGFAVGEQGVPAEVSFEEARELFRLIPPPLKSSALTVHADLEAIIDMALAVRPSILHICSETEAVGVEDIRRLRRELPPGMEVMKAVEVGGPETAGTALDAARRFGEVSDYLLLDTAAPHIPGIGASGLVHDWTVSRRIVDTVRVPVILAGGLGPDNVARAIEVVRPAGVDSYTRTSRDERRKDLDLVAQFVRAARGTSGVRPGDASGAGRPGLGPGPGRA